MSTVMTFTYNGNTTVLEQARQEIASVCHDGGLQESIR